LPMKIGTTLKRDLVRLPGVEHRSLCR